MATCSSADSVLEAAALIRTNGAKINTFTNGTASQTVQLGTGAAATPTLRKFIADAQAEVNTVVSSSTPIDAALSASSTNPVQNAVIHAALALKADDSDAVHVDEYMTEAEVAAIFE